MTIADLVTKRPLLSLAVLLGIATAVTQPSKAAVMGNGYWQETKIQNCAAPTICSFAYSAVPAGKQVTVTNVSCALRVNGTPPIREIKLSSTNSPATTTYLTPTLNGVSGGIHYYAINNSSVHILKSGDKANITVLFDNAPNGISVNCTLGGRLIPA